MSLLRKVYNSIFSSDKELIAYVRSVTGVTPNKIKLYQQVFNHRSLYGDARDNNERLELLGDSVLDMLVAEFLYKKYPYKEEGFITELRAKIVNRKSLNETAQKLGLLDKINLNKKVMTGMPKDIGGNTFEALIGALYLDAGFDPVKKFVFKRVLQDLLVVDDLEITDVDFKSMMYHYIQREGKTIEFKAIEEQNHNRRSYFIVMLEIDGKPIAKGEGYSKKVAEQNAAMNALKELKEV
ncbi:MAG: rnc [Bacteroidetes bacterium]|nr:rnc [Bacteroidota bacterium]